LISFNISHLNYYSVSALQLAPWRAVAVRQQQLDGANLLIHVDLVVFSLAGADPPKLLD
jgi:hypothetical protein